MKYRKKREFMLADEVQETLKGFGVFINDITKEWRADGVAVKRRSGDWVKPIIQTRTQNKMNREIEQNDKIQEQQRHSEPQLNTFGHYYTRVLKENDVNDLIRVRMEWNVERNGILSWQMRSRII